MLNNHTKMMYPAITLIEVLVYLALFGTIFTVVVMLLVQMREQNGLAIQTIKVEQNAIFIDEHINLSIEATNTLSELESAFETDNGKLHLILDNSSEIKYELAGGVLYLNRDGVTVPLSNSSVYITEFRVSPVLDEESEIKGVRVAFELTGSINDRVIKSWENFYRF